LPLTWWGNIQQPLAKPPNVDLYGSYHFWPKKFGFRDDYCLGCQAPRRSIAIRTLDVGHPFWIPILPVGFWKQWKCSMCHRGPHANTRTRRSFKWIGVVGLILIALAFWTTLSIQTRRPFTGVPDLFRLRARLRF
jgi:hypothetical protein